MDILYPDLLNLRYNPFGFVSINRKTPMK